MLIFKLVLRAKELLTNSIKINNGVILRVQDISNFPEQMSKTL